MIAVLAVAACAPASAGAERGHTIRDNRHLWATINICDTLAHPDAIGIRGSMPGTGRDNEQMYMRFQAQYFRASDGLWHNIANGGDSGFVHVGSSMFKARQVDAAVTWEPDLSGAVTARGDEAHVLVSTTAATNSSSDSDINWSEGQSPGSVNNSARALMAGVAGWLRLV